MYDLFRIHTYFYTFTHVNREIDSLHALDSLQTHCSHVEMLDEVHRLINSTEDNTVGPRALVPYLLAVQFCSTASIKKMKLFKLSLNTP